MELCQIQPGMFLRLADVMDRYDLHSEALLHPGLKVAWVLEGQAEVSFAGRGLQLGPEAGPQAPRAVVVALDNAEAFCRQGRAGRKERKERTLTMTLSQEWLQRYPYATHQAHLQICPWRPSPALALLARQLILGQGLAWDSLPQRLMGESLAYAMLGEALASRDASAADDLTTRPLTLSEDRRMQRLKESIDNGEADQVTQSELATRLGMSLSTLQRQFRRHCDESLAAYLRHRRLVRAYQALEHERIDLDSAAGLAGYTSTANFATAFKRQFGIRPSELRRQCDNARDALPGDR